MRTDLAGKLRPNPATRLLDDNGLLIVVELPGKSHFGKVPVNRLSLPETPFCGPDCDTISGGVPVPADPFRCGSPPLVQGATVDRPDHEITPLGYWVMYEMGVASFL